MRRNRGEIGVAVRWRVARDDRLDDALGDEIGVSSIGRCSMRVVVHGETEVRCGRTTRYLDDVLTRSEKFDHGERQIGKPVRVRGLAGGEECRQCRTIRRSGKGRAETSRELHDTRPPCRRAYHSVDRGSLVAGNECRERDVGGDHELFDQVSGWAGFGRV